MSQKLGGVDVSRETFDDLNAFSDLVVKWTAKINLVAKASIPEIWDRHVLDSIQIYQYTPETYQKWVDIGSGGGFPGVVMAILAKEHQPNAAFTFIESDQRKATFLRTAARELDLPVDVVCARIEEATPQAADVVSARALTALSGLLPLAERHLTPEGTCILHKGRRAQQEIADAQSNWRFDLEDHASITDPEARILVIQRILARGK